MAMRQKPIEVGLAIGDVQRIRIMAVGDVHLRADNAVPIQDVLWPVGDGVDLVLLTGDMTDNGRMAEVEQVARVMGSVAAPIYAVMGNHDRRTLRRKEFRRALSTAGVKLLDGESTVFESRHGLRVGLVGVGGYGGGFWPDEAPDLLSTRFSQAVAVRARREAVRLEAALDALENRDTNLTIVVMHYAPTTTTLGAEPMMKHWMLGNSILGRVVDRHDVTLVLHGHAHLGNYQGVTPGGTPVRNVALPVVGAPVILEVGRDRVVDRFDRHKELAVRMSAGSRDRPRIP